MTSEQILSRFLLLFITMGTYVPASPMPIPTPAQLVYQDMEMGALITYNMATAAGTQGCGMGQVPAPSIFNDNLAPISQTDQWCKAVSSFGGKYATLVAKHLCGFTLWPTAARSGNFTYSYGVNKDRDIVRDFAESCSKYGVKIGLYYSVNVNTYLGVTGGKVTKSSPITQNQYVDIVTQQLTELWGNYGNLAEIWFDGGYQVDGLEDVLLPLLNKYQRNAAVFGGCGLTMNSVTWIGTESGYAPYPVWNAHNPNCAPGAGSIDGSIWQPKEVDMTLQKYASFRT